MALPVLGMVGIFCLSEVPGKSLPEWTVQGLSVANLAHFPVYFALGASWLLALEAWPVRRRKAQVLAVLLATLFGALDEVHQSFVPQRAMDFWDGVVNCSGASCAAIAWSWIRGLFFSPGTSPEDRGGMP